MQTFRLTPLALAMIGALSGCSSLSGINQLPTPAADGKTYQQGVVYRDFWRDFRGGNVSALNDHPTFPNNPDGFDVLKDLSGPANWGDNYGARVQALVTPPSTGSYTFYVSGDDDVQLWLSEDATPAKKRLIASVPGYTSAGQWTKYASQISEQIHLEQGKQYYLEVLHRESSGGDHFAVAWESASTSFQVIGGSSIAPYIAGVSGNLSGDFQQGYTRGYRVGYDDGRFGYAYDNSYPPKDTDKDGLPDNWELAMGFEPQDASDALRDHDNDLLTTYDEYVLRTDPNSPDTDGDGLPDGYEAAYGFNPLSNKDAQQDLDGDGVSNLDEYLAKTDPTDPKSLPKKDVPAPAPGDSTAPGNTLPGDSAAQGLKVEYWHSIPGDKVADLTKQAAYPDKPSSTETLSQFKLPGNMGDQFGARISGYLIPPATGDYRFHLNSDDQSELYLSTDHNAANKSQIVSVTSWQRENAFNKSQLIHLEAGKPYYIEALYKENSGTDFFQVAWEGPGISRTVIDGQYLRQAAGSVQPGPSPSVKLVNGLFGQYFNASSLSDFAGTRIDANIDFNWDRGAPISGVNTDYFSVRWQGKVLPSHTSGTKNYRFYVRADDGVRLWVDNQLLVDQWVNQSGVEHSGTIALEAGRYYDIKVEYYDHKYAALVSLSWQPDGGTKTIVPAANLFSLDTQANSRYDGDGDAMDDVWELQNGLDTASNDAGTVLNSRGISAVQAFQQGLNPWTGQSASQGQENPIGNPLLTWQAPTTRTDGSKLDQTAISHYELKYGTSPTSMNGTQTIAGTATSYEVKGLTSGNYYFVIQAVDKNGTKSQPSNRIEVSIP